MTKEEKLRYHKRIATGLFIGMALLYIAMVVWQKYAPTLAFIGYIKAFSEAAMVGALADWFAVTALFNKPLGLPIPHTNLIENRKKDIGDNLGGFVVENFLKPENIRPYVQQIEVSEMLSQWLSKDKNIRLILDEIEQKWQEILQTADDEQIADFIANRSKSLVAEIEVHTLAGDALNYVLQKGEHQKLLDFIFKKIEVFIADNKEMVRERVAAESLSFIPQFVNNILADKITDGLASYISEITNNQNHNVRLEIGAQLGNFAEELHHSPRWQSELGTLKDSLLGEKQVMKYSHNIWQYIKNYLTDDLSKSVENSAVKSYLYRSVQKFAENMRTDNTTRQRIDGWVRKTAYQFVLKNKNEVGNLISRTVGNWQGRELSEKLELEVGKDLQFIRINGTLVGGLVGLFIYIVTKLFA